MYVTLYTTHVQHGTSTVVGKYSQRVMWGVVVVPCAVMSTYPQQVLVPSNSTYVSKCVYMYTQIPPYVACSTYAC